MSILQLFGYLSGLLTVIGCFPYIRDIIWGKTRPERASWFIWGILIIIQFFSQLSKGATDSLWLSGTQMVEIIIIFLLSLKLGRGGLQRKDYLALFAAGVGLLFWYFTKEAAIALWITIGIDAVGGILTVEKTYHHPESETASLWILSLLAGIFASLAVGKINVVLLSYPVYVVILTSSILFAKFIGKRKLANNLIDNKVKD